MKKWNVANILEIVNHKATESEKGSRGVVEPIYGTFDLVVLNSGDTPPGRIFVDCEKTISTI